MAEESEIQTATSFRRTLHSAYSLIRSIDTNRSLSALTLDHLIQEQIDFLEPTPKGESEPTQDARGVDRSRKGSRMDELESIERDLGMAVRKLREAGDDPEKLRALGIFNGGES